MGMKRSEKEIAAAQKDLREQTSKAIKDFDASGGFQRFAPSPLQTAMPQLQGSTSFLGGGVSPYAQSMAYQRLPGMTYANLPGTTTAFYPQANVAPPVATTPPASGGISELYKSEPAIEGPAFRGREISEENQRLIDDLLVAQNERDFEEALKIEDFIKSRDMLNDGIFKIQDFEDYIGGDNLMMAAEGGIASLPVQMSSGGTLAAPGQTLGGTSAGNLMSLSGGGVGGAGVGMNPTMPSASDKPEDKKTSSQRQSPYANMTREQLIALLEKDKQVDIGDELTRLGQAFMPQILAEGGEAFPRMNGPISGPGTETSDDIPAMLSDGEFVVNAKAVRGVGKLNGAGKTKEEQRREGARMMYALQKAGEQAMRKT
jgi:hypothetical protein